MTIMNDPTYQVLQDGDTYRVCIKRMGEFVQEADGFGSIADANAWIAEDQRLVVRDDQQEPIAPPHLRVV